jgi:CRISPR-associated endonuclease/helicase Cas3
MALIAHVKKKEHLDEWDLPHTLLEHLIGTQTLAEKWGKGFGSEKLCRILGLVHDAGKASAQFQKKIRLVSGYQAEQFLGENPPSAPHSDSGAQLLLSKYGRLAKILAYVVAGHHGGLPNGLDDEESCLSARLKRALDDFEEQYSSLQLPLPEAITPPDIIRRPNMDGFSIAFYIRMLFSCLVDADFLDTEVYMSPGKSMLRGGTIDFSTLLEKLNCFIDQIAVSKKDSPISLARAAILSQCKEGGKHTPGFFSLTVPTGGGKTLSSMAFALTHAVIHDKHRIIYAIPFTSIIEQNAAVFKKALGENVVLEHHSSIDPDDKSYRNKLASENWDAPIIVTTNIQLFESLFAHKPSKCRKLHNIANSVIVIDEAQMLHPDYLRPTLRAIKELVEEYGCTVVLCTATQPALNKSDAFAEGLEGVREIIRDPKTLYEQFHRVRSISIDRPFTIQALGERLRLEEQVLCIVNRRRDAFSLYRELGEDKCNLHLSTFMCAAHRTAVFGEIRERLSAGRPCRVISTQLIEAGVDVDFPVVYRAEAGIDSIAQAAGRCNREGRRKNTGEVYVFKLEQRPPSGLLRQSADEGNKTIRLHGDDILSLEAVHDYFEAFYWKRRGATELDKKKIVDAANEDVNPNLNFPFREMSRDYCLIENNTAGIVIPWREGKCLCEKLMRSDAPDRYLLRKLQRYLVQARREVLDELLATGTIMDVFADGSVYVLVNEKQYDPTLGLITEQSLAFDTASLIV